MKKKIMAALLCGAMMCSLSACRESERVAYNISKEADNFNVTRRLEVINARTDKPVFELIGNFAISNNSENELEVTVETGQGVYKKHLCVPQRLDDLRCGGRQRRLRGQVPLRGEFPAGDDHSGYGDVA